MFTAFSAKLGPLTEWSSSIYIVPRASWGQGATILSCSQQQLKTKQKFPRSRRFFSGNPIYFFLQMLLGKSDALKNALAVFDHVGVAAQISNGVGPVESPQV